MSLENNPLKIYVLWHPNFNEGYDYAEEIYINFTRDIRDPSSRGIGIPVFFRPRDAQEHGFIDINYSDAEKVAIIIFVDDNMVIDNEWNDYIERIFEKCKDNSKYIIYPVAISNNALKTETSLNPQNFIRLFDETSEKKKMYLISKIAHELCRLIYNQVRISEANCKQSEPPIKLFISHAKIDGEQLAKRIDNHINQNTSLKTFFDSQDIATGYEFSEEITAEIQNAALLVVYSDKYSSREWCRREIILAKNYNRPIVVLNSLEDQEDRSFPYMSNVKTIRVSNEISDEKIIFNVLKEVLRYKYQELFIRYVSNKRGYDIENSIIFSCPPELFSLVQKTNEKTKTIIYPDPPLGDEELELLYKYKSDITYITPTLLPYIDIITKKNNVAVLTEYNIGISVSENKYTDNLGVNLIHLQDATVEIARYMLACGINLSYGGDVNYNQKYNFVGILTNLAENHNKEHKKIKQKISNYVANYIVPRITVGDKSNLCQVATFVEMPQINGLDYGHNTDMLYKNYTDARDLTQMRQVMDCNINARIILGGKTEGYAGKYPGVLEEVYIALISNKPIYIMGAYGGASKEIIKCLKGENSIVFTEDYQFKYNSYKDFYEYYNNIAESKGIDKIDYSLITDFLSKKGVLGLNNGLSEEENETLFNTNNIIEAISLILKGLVNNTNK